MNHKIYILIAIMLNLASSIKVHFITDDEEVKRAQEADRR